MDLNRPFSGKPRAAGLRELLVTDTQGGERYVAINEVREIVFTR